MSARSAVPPVITRFSAGTATGWPNSAAAARGYASALTAPSRNHSTRSMSIPLSKTDVRSEDVDAVTNGVHASPCAAGSEYRVSGSSVSFSPTRVPPGADRAVRPSCAPRPSIVHAR
jgi:hypothetical protein